MDLLIPDNWLRDFLKTKATPKQIAESLSLCGPSVERINKVGNESVYSIEVTTNRVDSASVYGISTEAAAILPRFGLAAKLVKPKPVDNKRLKKTVTYLKVVVDKLLCPRFTAVLVRNVKVTPSPKWMQERLNLVGVRPINNVVDISNYIMHELGQPVHTFDYDKIKRSKMVLRESKKGEVITTLDGKTHKLPGGDIVIEDGDKRLIDLAGIMGAQNSAVDEDTKNVLLFVQTYNPVKIRHTSMALAHRTEAAELFEKGLDPELVGLGIQKGIDLFTNLKAGKPVSEILDIYPHTFKPKYVQLDIDFINLRLGIEISQKEVVSTLGSLGFEVKTTGKTFSVGIPSHRAGDIELPEDIVEEVARIYGYHNLPSRLMPGIIPDPLPESSFEFEQTIKNLLSGWGGVEVYTQSLVWVTGKKNAYKLKNPLGKDSEYLRNTLMPSLVDAANSNKPKESFHLFEIANTYQIQRDLPKENMTLAGIFSGWDWRQSKGIIEALLGKLGIQSEFIQEEESGFAPSKHISVKGRVKTGHFGVIENDYIYYEFDIEGLRACAKSTKSFRPIAKYPPQIEDITFKLPEKTKVGEVIAAISSNKLVEIAELKEIYKDSYTFRVWYQDPNKTLDDKEVEVIRQNIISLVEKKFGGKVS